MSHPIVDAVYMIGFILWSCTFVVLGLAFPVFILVFIFRRFELGWVWRNFPRGPRIKPAPSFWLLLLYLIVIVSDCRGLDMFMKFQRKAKQSEARTNLGAIFTTQVSYFANTNTYAGGPDAFDLLNWAPSDKTLYAYYCGEDYILNTSGDPVPCYPFDRCPFFDFWTESSSTGFTCLAVGNIDYDGLPDVWTINDAKEIINVYSDLGTARDLQPGQPPILLFPDHPVRASLHSARDRVWDSYPPAVAAMVGIVGAFALVWLTWREEKRYRADKRRAGEGDE